MIYGTNHPEILSGTASDDTIVGRGGSDFLNGRDGNDWLYGGLGLDFMFGGAGADNFVIPALSPFASLSGVDRIVDFVPGEDHIVLGGLFITADTGDLADGAFTEGRRAKDADDRVIYNPRTGAVFFDHDGLGGSNADKIAKIDKGLDLSADDFLIAA